MKSSDRLLIDAHQQMVAAIDAVDPALAEAMRSELHDQRKTLKLIASENYASLAILGAMGNWFSDKYAEGTVGHRFYAGCANVDDVEHLAAERARSLFAADHAYVQPHSGIDANLVAFWAILRQRVELPELERLSAKSLDDIAAEDWHKLRAKLNNQRALGMSLDAGGHLTHGFRKNISGKLFNQASYGVDQTTGLVDYAQIRKAALEFRPLIIIAGYSAYPRRLDFAKLREIADEVDATLMVDMAHFAGLVAGGIFSGDENPVAHAQIVTSTTHKSLRGPRGGVVLAVNEFAESVDHGCPLVLGGPLPHVMAAKAIAFREAATTEFKSYARSVADSAQAMADRFLSRGSTLLTGGTDNHLIVLNTGPLGLTGRQAESALLDVGIVTNRNMIPSDPNGSWYTSGIRLGTPALTTRGLDIDMFGRVADLIVDTLEATTPGAGSKARYSLDEGVAARVRDAVRELTDLNPLYPGLDLE